MSASAFAWDRLNCTLSVNVVYVDEAGAAAARRTGGVAVGDACGVSGAARERPRAVARPSGSRADRRRNRRGAGVVRGRRAVVVEPTVVSFGRAAAARFGAANPCITQAPPVTHKRFRLTTGV